MNSATIGAYMYAIGEIFVLIGIPVVLMAETGSNKRMKIASQIFIGMAFIVSMTGVGLFCLGG